MRFTISVLAFGAIVAASPAVAQLNVGLGGQGGLGVGLGAPGVSVGGAGQVGGQIGIGVDGRGTIDRVTGRGEHSVNRVDGTVNGALGSELRVASSADLAAGTVVRDDRGRRVGAVQSVQGDTAVVVRGDDSFHVPVASLYRSTSGLVTSLSRAQIEAMASAHANAAADVRN